MWFKIRCRTHMIKTYYRPSQNVGTIVEADLFFAAKSVTPKERMKPEELDKCKRYKEKGMCNKYCELLQEGKCSEV